MSKLDELVLTWRLVIGRDALTVLSKRIEAELVRLGVESCADIT